MATNQGGNKGGGGRKQSHVHGTDKQSSQGSKQSGTGNRGFASMDPDRQREIASQGGRAAHASGNAHEFTSEEAREAGRQSHKNDGNRQHDAEGGNKGTGGGAR